MTTLYSQIFMSAYFLSHYKFLIFFLIDGIKSNIHELPQHGTFHLKIVIIIILTVPYLGIYFEQCLIRTFISTEND